MIIEISKSDDMMKTALESAGSKPLVDLTLVYLRHKAILKWGKDSKPSFFIHYFGTQLTGCCDSIPDKNSNNLTSCNFLYSQLTSGSVSYYDTAHIFGLEAQWSNVR
ncbi:hypothetical protein AVEN_50006-1 [Araneus ventricosus]|uniref:Uncharacterized protein n=1 Tax=Araneus ventricosus TaxID=182803 RepID=A0A4Y2D2V9_ARAVE|nr:hypothetical protein AVEN_50006-1 [Araneus ventricosus]